MPSLEVGAGPPIGKLVVMRCAILGSRWSAGESRSSALPPYPSEPPLGRSDRDSAAR